MSFRRPVRVFCSYSHRDGWYLDRLKTALAVWQRSGELEHWDDRKITAGIDWALVLNEKIRGTQLFLLLVSPDFLASDYCIGIELAEANEMAKRRMAAVIPIIIRECKWERDLGR